VKENPTGPSLAALKKEKSKTRLEAFFHHRESRSDPPETEICRKTPPFLKA
jgi:hypothetical protein